MRAVPMGRMSQPSEIAGVVRWLLSKDARGITGQGIDINGGFLDGIVIKCSTLISTFATLTLLTWQVLWRTYG